MLRYVHFFVSLAAVLLLVLVFHYRGGALGQSGLTWFIAGLAAYYTLGIALALVLKDNRAFCKYVCPISVPLKLSSRFALLRVTGTADACGECIACIELCPMNIRVRDYLTSGERVLSTECTLCQTCINICPHDSLKLSFGFDRGGKELIDYEPPRHRR
jgi:polyferredoxin